MIDATEHQLQLVSHKAERLQQAVAQEVGHVRKLREARDGAMSEVERLTQQLEQARQRADALSADHDEATLRLKQTAADYSKAQVLRKRYQNTLAELRGGCRVVATVSNLSDHPESEVIVADECTINLPRHNKQFVFDAVVPIDTTQDDHHDATQTQARSSHAMSSPHLLVDGAGFSIRSTVIDVLSGFNCTVIAYGTPMSGTSALLLGGGGQSTANHGSSLYDETSHHLGGNSSRHRPTSKGIDATASPAASVGVVQLFLGELFAGLQQLEVTHYNMRLSVGEITAGDAVHDLLSTLSPTMNLFGGAGGGTSGPAVPSAGAGEIRLLPFQTQQEAEQLLRNALAKRSVRSKGHTVVSFIIENFDVRGHFRKSVASFVDLAGATSSESVTASHPDQHWVNHSVGVFSDAVAKLSKGQAQGLQLQQLPHVQSPILQLMADALGGNCKATLLLNIQAPSPSSGDSSHHHHNTSHHPAGRVSTTIEDLSAALVNAYQFKSIHNRPVPCDIPPELQRLQAEADEFQ